MGRRFIVFTSAITLVSFSLFFSFLAQGIFGGDSGDLVSAGYLFGVPHPPGYPLYTLFIWIATRLPWFTPAWRAGLVSASFHAATVGIVSYLVCRLTKSRLAGVFSASVLAGNYLFFLYSITAEVFALFDFFIIFLLLLMILWKETRDHRYLLGASFVFGLSLTHHHVIAFLTPVYGFWLLRYRHTLFKAGGARAWFIGKLVGLFLLGLLPYLYIPFAAGGRAVINWDHAVNIPNFIRLVTRDDYGTFVTNGFYGALLVHRLLALQAYVIYLVVDLTWIGIVLAVVGAVWVFGKSREYFILFVCSLLLVGPVFIFYASFPLANRFSLATYERFLLPSYTILALLEGFGLYQCAVWVKALACRVLPEGGAHGKGDHKARLFAFLGVLLLFVYPISVGSMTIWRFWGITTDKTADNLGRDILEALPANAIVFVSRDTPLFASQYVRYALGIRSDVILIHANRMWSRDYQDVLRSAFPLIVVPKTDPPSVFAREFIAANSPGHPIYTNSKFPLENGMYWVPEGLLYRLTKEHELPVLKTLEEVNEKIWQSYRDPTTGILGRYNHLMLSDVRGVYADARLTMGRVLLRGGATEGAREQFIASIHYGSDSDAPDAYTLLGLTELFLKHCDAARSAFGKARETSLVPSPVLTYYEAVNFRDCDVDSAKASELFSRYEKIKQSEEIPIAPQ